MSGLTLFLGALVLAPQEEAAQRPNVLIVLADDLGFSDLGCYGGEIETPHLDRLATGGLRFSQFSNSARCCPSRASLLTGLHPHQAGIGSFTRREPRPGTGPAYSGRILPGAVSLAVHLRDAGYSTWMVGKWHLGLPGPIEQGFEHFFGFADLFAYAADQWSPDAYARLPEGASPELESTGGDFYATEVFSGYALEFLRQARAQEERPWLLYLAHSAPHFPIQAPRATIEKYVGRYRRGWDVLRSERFARMKRIGLFDEDAPLPPRSLVPVDRDEIANGYPGRPNPAWEDLAPDRREDLAHRMATYAAMVEHVDRGVGRIVADLERHGELANTLILFLSDNGACYEWGPFGFDGPSRQGRTVLHSGAELERIGQPGTHQSYGSGWANLCNTPLAMYKHFCHEGGIASPLIVHWPEGLEAAGEWSHEPAHIMDLAPTILEASGVSYPGTRAGRAVTPLAGLSLLPACRGKALPARALAFEHQGARALRRGRFKVVWSKREPEKVRWRLYDLRTDRFEQEDLVAARPVLAAELIADWEAWARRVGAQPFPLPDPPRPGSGHPVHATPAIAGLPIEVVCEVEPRGAGGVIVAQGGQRFGYALHLVGGRLAFDVRIDGEVTRLLAEAELPGRFRAVARLGEATMELFLDGERVARIDSPGLIPVQPSDGLDVGRDLRTAAGDYQPPNAFDGEIHALAVEARD